MDYIQNFIRRIAAIKKTKSKTWFSLADNIKIVLKERMVVRY
jgi:hypothetical protein